MQSKGRELHAKAANARETGQYQESLDYNDQALFAYDQANDTLGFAEGIACRSITLRVYANLHNSKRLLTLAKYEMMAAVAIARESDDKTSLALPLFNLAQLHEDFEEFADAVTIYKEAVDAMTHNPPLTHNRPSVVANMQVHMETCAYKAGDKMALERALEALQKLENANEPSTFNKDIWVSGGYMRIADILKDDNNEKAKEYLQKAKEIIDANPKLTIRKKQWDQYAIRIRRSSTVARH